MCRVRVLEQERTARRTGVMQVATINTICCLGLLNVGTQLALAGQTAGARLACWAASAAGASPRRARAGPRAAAQARTVPTPTLLTAYVALRPLLPHRAQPATG